MLHFLVLLLASVFVGLVPAYSETINGRVIGISDGDTLTILVEKGTSKTPVKIRLAEIDAPESKQPWGKRAKQALSALAYGKQASAEVQTTDRYGRKVAQVFVNEEWVNARLVKDGNAWVYRQYSKNPDLLRLEDEARTTKRGLWSLPESQRMPPWEWRRGSRQEPASAFDQPAVRSPTSVAASKSDFQCGAKRTCSQMTSCAEAQFYLNQCGLSRLDRDGDGVPCESLCR